MDIFTRVRCAAWAGSAFLLTPGSFLTAQIIISPGPVVVIALTPTSVTQQTTIQLGQQLPIVDFFGFFPPGEPVMVAPGADLKILALAPGATYGPVKWYKNGKLLATTGATLEIAAAAAGDSGTYYSAITDANGRPATSDSPMVLVSSHFGPRLANYSMRAQVSRAQPTFVSGFVVEAGPANRAMLIRAVGPSLAAFGVAQPLAAPNLKVFDGSGQLQTRVEFAYFLNLANVAAEVGAFPLPAASGDVTDLYDLPAGAYSVQVSAADGGSGEAMLEVYEAPF